MIIKMIDTKGNKTKFPYEGELTLEEASKFDNKLMKVYAVDTEKFGTATINDAYNIIEKEGLGYVDKSYISGNEFADPKLRELWNNAERVLKDLEEYVGVG